MFKSIYLFIPMLLALLIWADDNTTVSSKTTQFYSGQGRITNLITGQTSKQDLILLRIIDPQKSMLTEIACYKEENKPTEVSPVFMRIEGNNLTLADTPDVDHPSQLKGTGSVWGQPWNWSYLKFSMTHSTGVKIEDSNWVVGNMIIARKQLFLPNGMPLMLWEAEVPQIEEQSFNNLKKTMGCPEF